MKRIFPNDIQSDNIEKNQTNKRNKQMKKRIHYGVIGLSFLFTVFHCVQAQDPEINQIPLELEQLLIAHSINPQDLEHFVDGIMAVHIADRHIAGASFAAVQNGKTLLAKGYGMGDVAKNRPVESDKTLFRPGSISKLFTWTAVMQLYEQGKIDLNTDVNQYLKGFQIPETFPEPITMAHLLSHTPGFEEKSVGMGARKPEDLISLEEFLQENIPQRVRPPGQITSYSNYGSSLAGYIVECISGLSFEEYIENNIFEPLGMEHSTFRQPLPEHLAEDMSVGYKYENGVLKAEEFELLNGMAPAGALSTTGEDISKFMIAHLQKGQFNDAEILREETAQLMHTTLFTHDPRLNGNAHGFWEWDYNSLHTIGHGGDTLLFHSYLVLVPEHDLGIYVSYNSVGGSGASRVQLIESILDRYFPLPKEQTPKTASDKEGKDLTKLTGIYRSTRVNHSSIEKIARLFTTIEVNATDDQRRLISSGSNQSQWTQIDPLLFQKVRSQEKILFRNNNEGQITHLFLGDTPYFAFIKLKWHETPLFHFFVLGLTVFIFLTTFSWPLGALRRKICHPLADQPDAPKLFRLSAGIMSGLCVVFLIGLASILSRPEQMMYGIPFSLKIVLSLPFVALVFGVGVLIFSALVWIKNYWNWCSRLYYLLVLACFVVFLWFLNYWNLLGFQF
ncbi:MAG: serine hydrolase [Candidatus Aminicenantes bacterium]|nr:serine hydrolase [Candidatus Aminicenantes bacterium]